MDDPRPMQRPLRLPRAARLIRSADVRRVFDGGRSAAAGRLVVYAIRRDDERGARGAVVVGKRWAKLAHDRNRLRRRLREAFRLTRRRLAADADFVILPRAALEDADPRALRRWIVQAAERALARDPGEEQRPRKSRRRARSPAR